ncbi:toll-like receptor 13 isoform X1 [Ictalurus punctatus]|uniref:Toll-like receptor 13 isoform X1 n=3 Tax=Ictalurus punctatus TaxID=7998 RepID=A0A2D0R044_ICTPU|nr:toll-like receptor 13 isoform X1 [Ictalurus punctatus]
MGMYKPATVCSSPCLCLRFILYFSMSSVVAALISKRCMTFDEHLLNDIGTLCYHQPGLGPYGECKNVDFQKDLLEVETGIRSLCIYSDSTVIPASAFSHLATLEHLVIYGYNLRRIQSGAFSGLFNLKQLRVFFSDSDCSIVVLDTSVFAGLDNLEEIYLKGFRFSNIPNNTFEHLVSLVKLSLDTVCVEELGEVLCSVPDEMSRLKYLEVFDSGITSIRNRGCPSWPSAVLAGIQVLDLTQNPIKIIEAGSLAVFQNLSSLSLRFCGVWLGEIWESGVGKLSDIVLSGRVLEEYSTSCKDMCQLVSNLNLHTLELSYILLDSLSMEDLKDCGIELTVLGIYNSRVQQLDPAFWRSVAGIQTMVLAKMALTEASFCVSANGTVWNVTTLNLNGNHLTVVKTHQFVCTPLLEQLLLNENAITTLEPEAFIGLHHLKILKLSLNKIKMLAADDFRYLRSLEVLLIDENVISSIEDGIFRNQGELRELAFGRLEYVYELHLNLLFYGFPKDMQRLSIDADVGTSIFIGSIGRPKGSFRFELNGYMLYIGDNYPPFLESVRELKLSGHGFYLKNDFFVPYFTHLESLELSADPELVLLDYTGISSLRYLKRLKLINLNFSNTTNPGMTLWNLKQLQILVLYNCRLNFLTKMMFKDLHSLELLYLCSVNPLILQDGMFDVLPVLRAVVLETVNFRCDCETGWFLEWAQNTRAQVINLQKQQCAWRYQKLNLMSTMEKLCQTDVQYLCYLGTVNIISLLLLSALSYRFAYWPCMVFIFRLRGYMERNFGKRWWRRRQRNRRDELEAEEDMKYDAFVSFSSHDEVWVLEEFAPKLEEQGQPRLRLCLHSRDFEVGKGIVDNIAESIYSSRRTVCVLSRRYLRSDWCSLEMRVATHRLLEEQKHRLILIFLEHISPFELSTFHRLAKLVKSHTYLDWPQDEAERIHFWERLRRNIADGDMDAP